MKKLKNILENKTLLNEVTLTRDDAIKKAINDVSKVYIVYNDRKPNVISSTRGYRRRYILPVAYGILKNGKRAVRAFQGGGSSKRGTPKWKLFLLDNIVLWHNSTRNFKNRKDELIRLGLNTTGDKAMTTLFAITPFADKNVQVANDSNPITSEPIVKTDVTPTTNSQKPKKSKSTTSKEKFVPAQTKRNTSIDNSQDNSYFDNKVEAPSTEPITKTDLVKNEPETMEPNYQLDAPETEPVTKTDITGSEKNIDDVKTDFNNMMSRMDNLYNDEDEI
jgi:hypothetical protein